VEKVLTGTYHTSKFVRVSFEMVVSRENMSKFQDYIMEALEGLARRVEAESWGILTKGEEWK